MREAVLDGTVDAIVTDHSPHAPEEKDVEFRYAPNGFCGLETSLAVMLTDLYHTHVFDLNTIISKMSCEPAKLFKLAGGTLKEGSVADITIMDLNKNGLLTAPNSIPAANSPRTKARLAPARLLPLCCTVIL